MRDRLGAIGGTLKVTSAQGSGTTVAGRFPLEEPSTPKPESRVVGLDPGAGTPRRGGGDCLVSPQDRV
jgi:hypothetical protein